MSEWLSPFAASTFASRYGGQVAASAGHLAVARAELKRERRRMKEHAWKAILASGTKGHRNTSWRKCFNELAPQDAARCDSVNVATSHRPRTHLTQFLHTSQLHLLVYVVVFLGTRRPQIPWVRAISLSRGGPVWFGVQRCLKRQSDLTH